MKLPGPFATFSWTGAGSAQTLQTAKLLKHHDSAEHRRASSTFLGLADEFCLASPSTEDMVEHLRVLQSGRCTAHGTKSNAKTWCLREALLDIDRKFMKSARSLAICRDERHQRLLIRFTGSTANLETRSGVLGMARDMGATADNIVAATKQVFEQFCTPRLNAPRNGGHGGTSSGILDQKLLVHLQEIVEVIVVDEAANEGKAANIGRGRRASAMELEPITPNLKFVARDKAHGYRRNLNLISLVTGLLLESHFMFVCLFQDPQAAV